MERLHRLLSQLRPSWEIILVGNYLPDSGDRTPQVVREIAERLPHVRAIALEKKAMMGWDMRSGLAECRGAYLAVIDGDGQFPLEAVITCFLRIVEEKHDLVQTYRVRREDGLFRSLLSRCFNAFSRLLFPEFDLTDINSKPKIMTRKLYESLRLSDEGWFIDAEIVLKANLLGASIAREPIHFYRIQGRHSFVRRAAILEFIGKLVRFRRDLPAIRAALTAQR